jgi:hypothetical protein
MMLSDPVTVVSEPPIAFMPPSVFVKVAFVAPFGMRLGPLLMMLIHPLRMMHVPPLDVMPPMMSVIGAYIACLSRKNRQSLDRQNHNDGGYQRLLLHLHFSLWVV